MRQTTFDVLLLGGLALLIFPMLECIYLWLGRDPEPNGSGYLAGLSKSSRFGRHRILQSPYAVCSVIYFVHRRLLYPIPLALCFSVETSDGEGYFPRKRR